MIGVENSSETKVIIERDVINYSDAEICTEFNDFLTSIRTHLSGKIKCKGNPILYSCLSSIKIFLRIILNRCLQDRIIYLPIF